MGQHTVSTKDMIRIGRAVNDYENRPINGNLPAMERKVRLTGGGEKCSEVDCLNALGPVDGGSVTLSYTIDGTTEDVEIQWDDDADAVKTAYEGHSKIGAGNVKVVGGPWPSVALHVIFQGDLKGQSIEFPAVDDNLTGGGVFNMWKSSSANWKGYDS